MKPLREFCASKNSGRKVFENPFNCHGHTIATDGCIFVAINKDEIYPSIYQLLSKTDADKYADIIDCALYEIKHSDLWRPLPDLDFPKDGQCFECDGFGVVLSKNTGEGLLECPRCLGSGGFVSWARCGMKLFGSEYSYKYLSYLRSENLIEISPSETRRLLFREIKDGKIVKFGLIMRLAK